MDVRLAIRYDDDVLAAQLALEDAAQRFRGPGELFFVAEAMIGLDISNQASKIVGDRLQLCLLYTI
jgi:hypothetical protein